MTTFVQFTPTPQAAFAFQATLDGVTFRIEVRWNLFGQRWYLTCTDQSNNPVFHLPMIASPDEGEINIVRGYFVTSSLVFRQSSQQFEIAP